MDTQEELQRRVEELEAQMSVMRTVLETAKGLIEETPGIVRDTSFIDEALQGDAGLRFAMQFAAVNRLAEEMRSILSQNSGVRYGQTDSDVLVALKDHAERIRAHSGYDPGEKYDRLIERIGEVLKENQNPRIRMIVVSSLFEMDGLMREGRLLDALAQIREMTFEYMEFEPEFERNWLGEAVSDPLSIPPMVKAALSRLVEELNGQNPQELINWLVKAVRDYKDSLEDKHRIVEAFRDGRVTHKSVRDAHHRVEDASRSLELALEAAKGNVDEAIQLRITRLEAVANAARRFVLDTSLKRSLEALEKAVCDLDILGVES